MAGLCGHRSQEEPPPKVDTVVGDLTSITPATKDFGAKFKWEGVGSCYHCHSNPMGHNEYKVWYKQDLHRKAFSNLYGKLALRIEKNLKHLANAEDAKPWENRLCLGCHAMDVAKELQSTKFYDGDGVGCEMCHGPSDCWGTNHAAGQLRGMGTEARAKWGNRNTKDLLVRVNRCVDCHVGIGDISVNHDLIAAGHPRLNFEYVSFLDAIPKHWGEGVDKRNKPDLEARVWSLGQVASAKAALDLLAHRTASKNAPWPEFSEYDCYACHHDLGATENAPHLSWRQTRGYKNGRPGALPWGTWYFTMSRTLADAGTGEEKALVSSLDELSLEMGKPYPNQEKVRQLSLKLSKGMGAWLDRLNNQAAYDGNRFREFVVGLANKPQIVESSWDGAAQFHKALRAVHAMTPDEKLNDVGISLGKKLSIDPDKPFDYPIFFDPTKLKPELKKLHE